MGSVKNTRKANTTLEQKRIMIQFMRKNPKLSSGKFTKDFTQQVARHLWQELSNVLNSCGGGAFKDWKSWRKTWQDFRSRTKTKSRVTKHYQRGTGGGPHKENCTTEFEDEVLDIMNLVTIEENPNVEESYSEFLLDNPQETHEGEFPRAPRKKSIYASEAAESYRISLKKKPDVKSSYYEKKLEILERLTIAKEKSADAKERMASALEVISDTLGEFLQTIH